jgi:hypothetical protein
MSSTHIVRLGWTFSLPSITLRTLITHTLLAHLAAAPTACCRTHTLLPWPWSADSFPPLPQSPIYIAHGHINYGAVNLPIIGSALIAVATVSTLWILHKTRPLIAARTPKPLRKRIRQSTLARNESIGCAGNAMPL